MNSETLGTVGPDQHRFNMPEDIYRVTAGAGGESFLIDGHGETAIYDCGMAYCNEGLIKNIKEVLISINEPTLNYIILSHSHYDHIGALPYILKEWPDVRVLGAEKLVKVFSSNGAKDTMKRLGESARDKYLGKDSPVDIITDGLRVDKIIRDGDIFNIGKYQVKVVATPGHTDCSLSYLLNPGKIFFLSESVGVLENNELLHTSILKSFNDTIYSAKKCKKVGADILVCSHYGIVPHEVKDKYFDMYIDFATREKDFILDLYDRGLSFDDIYQGYEDKYWNYSRVGAQPIEAFKENAYHTIECIVNNFRS